MFLFWSPIVLTPMPGCGLFAIEMSISSMARASAALASWREALERRRKLDGRRDERMYAENATAETTMKAIMPSTMRRAEPLRFIGAP